VLSARFPVGTSLENDNDSFPLPLFHGIVLFSRSVSPSFGLGAKDNLDSHSRGTSGEESESYFKHPPNDGALFLEEDAESGKIPISSTLLETTLPIQLQQYSPAIDGSISRLRIEN